MSARATSTPTTSRAWWISPNWRGSNWSGCPPRRCCRSPKPPSPACDDLADIVLARLAARFDRIEQTLDDLLARLVRGGDGGDLVERQGLQPVAGQDQDVVP